MAAGGRPTSLTHHYDYLEEDLKDPLFASAYIALALKECCLDEIRESFRQVSKVYGSNVLFDVFFAFDPNSLGGFSNDIIWVGAGEHTCIIVDNEFPNERFVVGYGLDLKTRKYTLTLGNKKLPFSEKIMQFIEEELNKKINQYIKCTLT